MRLVCQCCVTVWCVRRLSTSVVVWSCVEHGAAQLWRGAKWMKQGTRCRQPSYHTSLSVTVNFGLLVKSFLCCWVDISHSLLCLFLICLLSHSFQHEPTWMALYSLLVLMCRWEFAHSLTHSVCRNILLWIHHLFCVSNIFCYTAWMSIVWNQICCNATEHQSRIVRIWSVTTCRPSQWPDCSRWYTFKHLSRFCCSLAAKSHTPACNRTRCLTCKEWVLLQCCGELLADQLIWSLCFHQSWKSSSGDSAFGSWYISSLHW